jgi:drug/metabolite transporter (DMT)-like permease
VTYYGWSRRDYALILIWDFIALPAWLLLYFSLNVLPVGLAEALQNLTPFITLFLGYLLLKETMKSLEILNMFISFVGVMIIILFSSNYTSTTTNHGQTISLLMYLLGVLANSTSAALFGCINVLLRALKHIDTQAMNTLYSTVSFFISLCTFLIYRLLINLNGFVYNFTFEQISLLVLNGVLISIATYLYIKAF